MRTSPISDTTAQTLFVGMDGFFVMAWFGLGGFFLATGIATLRTGAFARWLGWTTIALAVLALVLWTGWIAEFLAVPWVLVVSALLIRQHRTARSA